ncbi:hypothetical protein BT63DRAFT_453547 [Microthyrium microscopicum]|uniref:Uncharacterized protein n=1 Tax=Microthyrium microscopicum TaxID=703497 RepID=A0A6A6UHX8_9PEZI|nr:hypothetical protein BT63DRAFT_453547 [Microthyrium microscopicum]
MFNVRPQSPTLQQAREDLIHSLSRVQIRMSNGYIRRSSDSLEPQVISWERYTVNNYRRLRNRKYKRDDGARLRKRVLKRNHKRLGLSSKPFDGPVLDTKTSLPFSYEVRSTYDCVTVSVRYWGAEARGRTIGVFPPMPGKAILGGALAVGPSVTVILKVSPGAFAPGSVEAWKHDGAVGSFRFETFVDHKYIRIVLTGPDKEAKVLIDRESLQRVPNSRYSP